MNVKYYVKKFQPIKQNKDLLSPIKIITYYGINHRVNTLNKNNQINRKITFKRKQANFYMNIEHNEICNNKNSIIYDHMGISTSNVYEFFKYKEELIKFI